MCIAGEDHSLIAVFHKPADRVLSVARSMQSCHFDVLSNLETLLMSRSLRYRLAVFAANHGKVFKMGTLSSVSVR